MMLKKKIKKTKLNSNTKHPHNCKSNYEQYKGIDHEIEPRYKNSKKEPEKRIYLKNY